MDPQCHSLANQWECYKMKINIFLLAIWPLVYFPSTCSRQQVSNLAHCLLISRGYLSDKRYSTMLHRRSNVYDWQWFLSPFGWTPDRGAIGITPATVAWGKDALSIVITLLNSQRFINGCLTSQQHSSSSTGWVIEPTYDFTCTS